jgi:MFS family permease
LLALTLTGSPVAAGWVAAAGAAPGLLLYLPAGLLADRLNCQWIMFVSQVLRGTVAFFVAALVCADALSLPMLTLAAAIGGVCTTLYSVAEVSAVPRVVLTADQLHSLSAMKEEISAAEICQGVETEADAVAEMKRTVDLTERRISGAMATNEARSHAALLLGRPLGGLLYGMMRWWPFALDTMLCFGSALALAFMRREPFRVVEAERRRGVRALFRELTEGMVSLWADQFLRSAMAVVMVTNLLFQAVVVLLIMLGKHRGMSTAAIGVLLAAPGAGGMVGTLFASALLEKLGFMRVMVTCAWGWTALMVIIAVCSDPVIWIIAWGGVGFVGAHMNVALDTYRTCSVPRRLLGRVAGANRLLSVGAVPFGALYGGYIIAWFGVEKMAITVAALVGVVSLIVTFPSVFGRCLSSLMERTRSVLQRGADLVLQGVILGFADPSERRGSLPEATRGFAPRPGPGHLARCSRSEHGKSLSRRRKSGRLAPPVNDSAG